MESNKSSKEVVYEFLVKFITENLYSPSIREICDGTYLSSTSSVYDHLLTLKKEGRIEVKEYCPRTIKLVGYKLVKAED